MAVEVAAHVRQLDEPRRLLPVRLLPELGRTRRHAECRIHVLLGRAVRQRLQRGHVRLRPGRPHELGAEPSRLRDHDLDRHALDSDADGVSLSLLYEGDDLGELWEPFECLVVPTDNSEAVGQLRPATRIARHIAL
jgi:hypothetical protein